MAARRVYKSKVESFPSTKRAGHKRKDVCRDEDCSASCTDIRQGCGILHPSPATENRVVGAGLTELNGLDMLAKLCPT